MLVNGEALPSFKAKRGLRHGDPMSPYLFSLAKEYMFGRLARLKDNKEFGFHPKGQRTSTIVILFADDLLLFSKGNSQSFNLINQEIDEFAATFWVMCKCREICCLFSKVRGKCSRGDFGISGNAYGSIAISIFGCSTIS